MTSLSDFGIKESNQPNQPIIKTQNTMWIVSCSKCTNEKCTKRQQEGICLNFFMNDKLIHQKSDWLHS
jgi:hypothetical protein